MLLFQNERTLELFFEKTGENGQKIVFFFNKIAAKSLTCSRARVQAKGNSEYMFSSKNLIVQKNETFCGIESV